MMVDTNSPKSSREAKRPRLAPRALQEIYRLPANALLTPAETSLVTRLTESALSVRRSKGQWPPFVKFGRLVRYGLGDLLTPPGKGGER
ncbi:hypothetical protein CI1B_48900 [Bradyrhizobium ivorense]|uniref:DNA-binding protein n=1 Tax=Bradyrhizobium ivorense TaxID=2511166 RepID=A0A508TCV6_9BRAD|nr:hypothetical protein CI1B_48900 [Bradyrhizobium ivorense]